ncbi:hypothetical protein B0H14DRAFT_2877904 [Mycena olivaceomarginata]|nr:hypothetical protein B0H14DRAFT_2877904 [Mycena olivaceomarginata]
MIPSVSHFFTNTGTRFKESQVAQSFTEDTTPSSFSNCSPTPNPIFASRGGTSIRSFKFRKRVTTSNSTRTKNIGISSLLGRRTKNQPPPELNSLVLAEKLLDVQPRESSDNVDPAGLRTKIPSQRVTESVPSPAPNKQASIFRKLTTKFNRNRTRSSSPPPANGRNSNGVPQVTSGWGAQEARNAALRERGLLPSLPLSVQEAQQDSRIAIVAAPEPGQQQSGVERRPTAANRVKEEWEAKNRERLNGFRFGGNSPAASPMTENFPTTGLGAVKEVDTLCQFGAVLDELEAMAPRAPPPTLNLSRGQRMSPPLMQAWSDSPSDPCFLPLPPSPAPGSIAESNFSSLLSAFTTTPAADATTFTPMTPSFLPSPPSPSLLPDGAQTPRAGGDRTPHPPTEGTHLAPPARSQSIPRLDGSESESSLGVPSLVDSGSQSSASTSESPGSGFGRMRNVPLATKVRHSTIEPQGPAHYAISVIVESPGEGRGDVLGAGDVVSASPVEEEGLELQQQKAIPAVTPSEAAQAQPQPQTPRRRTTDPAPAAKVDRRPSLNVFKKMSIRRMGLSRAKSSASPRAAAVSALPSSPTLPANFAAQQRRGRPAASVSPTMHNAETILFEMNKIENEEERRMAEVAFM